MQVSVCWIYPRLVCINFITRRCQNSLVYDIECPDMYEVIKNNREYFDTSDYAPSNRFGMPLKNKVIGLMKDECNGEIMTEFVGLRSKNVQCSGRRRGPYEKNKIKKVRA